MIPGGSGEVAQFLSLLYQPNKDVIRVKIPINKWNSNWKDRKRRTSSSKSDLHDFHYRAQSQSNILSSVKFNLANLDLKNYTPLDR